MADRTRVRRSTSLDASGGANPDDAHTTDINKLMAIYRKNGTLPNVSLGNPLYGDFTGPADLQGQIEAVDLAFDRFREFPASVRTACDNDPVRFLEMIDDDRERALLEEAGLVLSDNPPVSEVSKKPTPSLVGGDGDQPATPPVTE